MTTSGFSSAHSTMAAKPQFKHFSLLTHFLGGMDENFYEWAPANVGYLSLTVNWVPTDKVRVSGTNTDQYFYRLTDGSKVAGAQIPRIKAEYQLARAIFFRLVGQYGTSYQDALRDDSRTGFPLLLEQGSGYVRTPGGTFNSFRADGLFSFLPSPGTVMYVGSGSTMTEETPFRFSDLTRTRDGLFVKASYLFRT